MLFIAAWSSFIRPSNLSSLIKVSFHELTINEFAKIFKTNLITYAQETTLSPKVTATITLIQKWGGLK